MNSIWRAHTWKIVVRGISKSQKAHVLTDHHIQYGIYEAICGRQIQRDHTESVREEDWKSMNIHRCKQCERIISMASTLRFSGGIFSNFANWPIELDGKLWPTSEHYYQAQKSHDPEFQEKIRRAPEAFMAADLGRSQLFTIREDWDAVKINVMRKALRAKFTQHDVCRNTLLNSGDMELIERTDRDGFWGDGKKRDGSNYLGKLLMETRKWLKDGEPDDEI